MVWRAASLRDRGQPFGKEAAMAKLLASETANEVTRACVQLFGGYGYTSAYPVERMMRDAKVTEIYEGTSEAQKMVISRAMGVR
jgi:butyryl-CoA dehydrogenase